MQPVALITGGARGIGRAIAEGLGTDHAIAITHHSTAPDALVTALPDVLPIRSDLADPTSAAKVIAQVITQFGRLDVLVNNAGMVAMDDADVAETFALNVAAPKALIEAALPHLSPGSSIVNISSINATFPAMGAFGYSASKAALETLTRGTAKALGPRGIRVNAIAPGAIERADRPRPPELLQRFVDMTALGRAGVPEDIAKVVRFLASDQAGFITGETLVVSGGYRL